MSFKLVNPNYKTSIEKKADLHKDAVANWLKNNSEKRLVSITDLREGLPAIAGDLSRQVVNQIAQIIGVGVEGAGEAE